MGQIWIKDINSPGIEMLKGYLRSKLSIKFYIFNTNLTRYNDVSNKNR